MNIYAINEMAGNLVEVSHRPEQIKEVKYWIVSKITGLPSHSLRQQNNYPLVIAMVTKDTHDNLKHLTVKIKTER